MVSCGRRLNFQNVERKRFLLDMVSTQDFILNSVDWGTESTHHYVNWCVCDWNETRAVAIMGWVIADRNDKEKQQIDSTRR